MQEVNIQFATNSNFLIPTSDGVNLLYFKLRLLNPKEYDIQIYRTNENLSL